MTLEEMKQKVYALIEEYNEDADDLTDDEDLATKMNTVINQIQNELIRYKKIPAYTTKEVKEGDEISLKDIDSMIYQLNNIRGVSYDTMDDRVTFEEDGEAKIYYYKYPKKIDMDTDDDYKPLKLIHNDKYIMNLFGHIHEKAKVKPYGLNVGIDTNHYYPFSIEEVEFYLVAILDYYDLNVFM
jgi:hypothetical protein